MHDFIEHLLPPNINNNNNIVNKTSEMQRQLPSLLNIQYYINSLQHIQWHANVRIISRSNKNLVEWGPTTQFRHNFNVSNRQRFQQTRCASNPFVPVHCNHIRRSPINGRILWNVDISSPASYVMNALGSKTPYIRSLYFHESRRSLSSSSGDDSSENAPKENSNVVSEDDEGNFSNLGPGGFGMALTTLSVPDVFPKVPIIPVSRNPVFPRFVKMIEVSYFQTKYNCPDNQQILFDLEI